VHWRIPLIDEFDAIPTEVQLRLKYLFSLRSWEQFRPQEAPDNVYTLITSTLFTTGNVKSEKHPDRTDLDPAIIRVMEWAMYVPYFPKDELHDIALTTMLDKYECIYDIDISEVDKHSSILGLFIEAVKKIEDLYLWKNWWETLSIWWRKKKDIYLQKAVLETGKFIWSIRNYRIKRTQISFSEHVKNEIIQFIANPLFPYEDVILLWKIFNEKNLITTLDVKKLISKDEKTTILSWLYPNIRVEDLKENSLSWNDSWSSNNQEWIEKTSKPATRIIIDPYQISQIDPYTIRNYSEVYEDSWKKQLLEFIQKTKMKLIDLEENHSLIRCINEIDISLNEKIWIEWITTTLIDTLYDELYMLWYKDEIVELSTVPMKNDGIAPLEIWFEKLCKRDLLEFFSKNNKPSKPKKVESWYTRKEIKNLKTILEKKNASLPTKKSLEIEKRKKLANNKDYWYIGTFNNWLTIAEKDDGRVIIDEKWWEKIAWTLYEDISHDGGELLIAEQKDWTFSYVNLKNKNLVMGKINDVSELINISNNVVECKMKSWEHKYFWLAGKSLRWKELSITSTFWNYTNWYMLVSKDTKNGEKYYFMNVECNLSQVSYKDKPTMKGTNENNDDIHFYLLNWNLHQHINTESEIFLNSLSIDIKPIWILHLWWWLYKKWNKYWLLVSEKFVAINWYKPIWDLQTFWKFGYWIMKKNNIDKYSLFDLHHWWKVALQLWKKIYNNFEKITLQEWVVTIKQWKKRYTWLLSSIEFNDKVIKNKGSLILPEKNLYASTDKPWFDFVDDWFLEFKDGEYRFIDGSVIW